MAALGSSSPSLRFLNPGKALRLDTSLPQHRRTQEYGLHRPLPSGLGRIRQAQSDRWSIQQSLACPCRVALIPGQDGYLGLGVRDYHRKGHSTTCCVSKGGAGGGAGKTEGGSRRPEATSSIAVTAAAVAPVAPQDALGGKVKYLKEEWDKLESSLVSGESVEAKVQGSNSGGILVRVGPITGFVPFSQLDPRRVAAWNGAPLAEAGSNLVGETLETKVIEVRRADRRLVLSEKKAATDRRLERIEIGSVVKGRVRSIVDFGAFMELVDGKGDSIGVDGLAHLSELSWDPIRTPLDVVSEGDVLEVKVVNVDRAKQRVGLSRKQLLDDPLLETLDTLMPAQSSDRLADIGANSGLAAWERAGLDSAESGLGVEVVPLPGLSAIVQELMLEEGVKSVAVGRQATEKRAVSQDLELWLSNVSVERGYKLLARAGRMVQEVIVETTLDREQMKEAVKRVTSRVA